MSETERKARTQEIPLPETKDDLFAFFKRAITLSEVQQIVITTSTISVTRIVSDSDVVIPPAIQAEVPDFEFLLGRIASALRVYPFRPTDHPYTMLMNSADELARINLRPTHLVAPSEEILAAWVGRDKIRSNQVLGYKVLYTQKYADKILLLGSSSNTGLLSDVVTGIIMDIVV